MTKFSLWLRRTAQLACMLSLIVACSDDKQSAAGNGTGDDPFGEEPLPLTIVTASDVTNDFLDADGALFDIDEPSDSAFRAEEFPTPANLYVFTFLKQQGGSYYLSYQQINNLTKADWTASTSATGAPVDYYLTKAGTAHLTGFSYEGMEQGEVGRTLAFATPRALSNPSALFGSEDWMGSVEKVRKAFAQGGKSFQVTGITSEEYAQLLAHLQTTATIDCGNDALWAIPCTQEDYRDIYTTPLSSTDNGLITWNGSRLEQQTVKLYHAAARYEFHWDIEDNEAYILRDELAGVWMRRMQFDALPTSCSIFNPTHSVATNGVAFDVADNTEQHAEKHGVLYNGALYPGLMTRRAMKGLDESTTPPTPLYQDEAESVPIGEVDGVEWNGVNERKRHQIFQGKERIYAFMPIPQDGVCSLPYTIELSMGSETNVGAPNPRRPGLGSALPSGPREAVAGEEGLWRQAHRIQEREWLYYIDNYEVYSLQDGVVEMRKEENTEHYRLTVKNAYRYFTDAACTQRADRPDEVINNQVTISEGTYQPQGSTVAYYRMRAINRQDTVSFTPSPSLPNRIRLYSKILTLPNY